MATIGKNYAKIYNREHPRSQKVFDRGGGPNGSGAGGGSGSQVMYYARVMGDEHGNFNTPIGGPDLGAALKIIKDVRGPKNRPAKLVGIAE